MVASKNGHGKKKSTSEQNIEKIHYLTRPNKKASGKPSNLIDAYQALKHSYRNYDTRLALRRMQALRRSVSDMTLKGYPIALELLGSVNFGLVEPTSDVDCVILHYCNNHLKDGECGQTCPNLIYKKNELLSLLKEHCRSDPFHVEFLDSINFTYIDQVINSKINVIDMHVLRFMFYRMLGRPVNRPLVIRYYELLEINPDLMDSFLHWGTDALVEYIKTSGHRHSFNKYNERIVSSHLKLPKDLIEELKNYLN